MLSSTSSTSAPSNHSNTSTVSTLKSISKKVSTTNVAADKSRALITARRIATKLQRYLILAIFSVVPDRQRTIRELSIGTTFQREDSTAQWMIRHGPDDYKTGKSYGERPPLVIPVELTASIGELLLLLCLLQ